MTYLEKLNEYLQHIVSRHLDAIERNSSDKVEESALYWHDWHCSDENMDKRYKHFNEVIERFLK